MSASMSVANPGATAAVSWRRALDDAYDCCRAAGLNHEQALELSEAAVVACCASADDVTADEAVARTRACAQSMLRERHVA